MRTIKLLAATAALTLLWPSSDARACGGFFCNRDNPVDQAAERILFAMDEGTVETHVQIFYEGDAEDFAWVLPLPGVPDTFLSSDLIFASLAGPTEPTFTMTWHERGTCDWSNYPYADTDFDAEGTDSGASGGGGVTVLETKPVGPYETAVLQASSAAELLTWLQGAGYDLPSTLDGALAPYVAEGSTFLALKLQKDKDVGDIAPIGVRYAASQMLIPIRLTSIAATPDMRLETYILGSHRGVPKSYLHVRINEAAIDWFGASWGSSNYRDVITLAADEAGGQAFATDYAGPSSLVGDTVDTARYDLDKLRTLTNPIAFVDEVMAQGFAASATLLELLGKHLPLPPALAAEGVTATDFYNCLACYEAHLDGIPFDPQAFAQDLDTTIVGPMRHFDDLLDAHPHLSRLTSSISPVEMTVDPTFVLNADMPQGQPNVHEAQLVFECGDGLDVGKAPRRLVLPDGRVIHLPPQSWFESEGQTETDFLAGLSGPAALVIERTGESGEPEPIFDYTDGAANDLAEHNRYVDGLDRSGALAGCGCTTAATDARTGMALLGVLLALVARTRRTVR